MSHALPDVLTELPVLGVGASLSFGAEPDPVALAAAPGGPSFIEYAGAVQHGWMRAPLAQLKRMKTPVLYHPSCLNLCGPYENPAGWLAAVAAHVEAVGSPWLAQDVAVCFIGQSPGYSTQLGYFLPPILTRASLEEAVARVMEVREAVPAPLLLEPAPVTFRLGDMDIFSWLGELAERTGSGLLLDCGHVVSHQLVSGRGLTEGIERLPLERVVELHVAGGVIQEREGRQLYIDAHDLPPLPEAWQVFQWLVQRCPELRAVCVECEGSAAGGVLPMLRKTRERVAFGAASEGLREAARRELSS